MSADARSASKHAGDAVETAVVGRVPEIEAVPDSEAEWCDARVVEAWLPPASVPLLPDVPVEIKAARVRLASGRRGRFYIRRRQHERLLAEGGVYVFAVYEETSGRPIRGLRVAAADAVDALLPDGWTDVDGPRSETGYRQLAWSRLLDTVTVEGDAETDGGRAECPACGAPVRAVVTVGPTEHHAQPCGHRVSGACVEKLRSEQGDGDGGDGEAGV